MKTMPMRGTSRIALVAWLALVLAGCVRTTWLDDRVDGGGVTDSEAGVDTGVDTDAAFSEDLTGPPNFDPGPCTVDGWCWVLPLPQGNPLNAIWGSGVSDVYAVGRKRTIVHFDGQRWEVVATGLPGEDIVSEYHAVWGFSASDVFVGGDDGLLHFDGNQWRSHGGWHEGPNLPRIYALWGSSRSALFATGDGGTILRFDGSRWLPLESGITARLRAIWGSSASDVFVAGDGGAILRLEGGAWQPMASGTEERINALWGASSSQLFAGTQTGDILRFDGNAWQAVHKIQRDVNAIWGRSATDVFFATGAGVLHYDGTTFSSRLASSSLEGLWSSPGGPMLAAGNGGAIYLEEGTTFTLQVGARDTFSDVWARSATEVYLVGGEELWRWDGAQLTPVRTFNQDFPFRVCGQSSGALFVAGLFDIYRRDPAGSWTGRKVAEAISDLWCSPESEHAVAVGWQGAVESFDGAQWTSIDTGATENFEATWGSAPSDIYALDWYGDMAHYDGSSWVLLPEVNFGPGTTAITGRSATEIYVMAGTTIKFFDGKERIIGQDQMLDFVGQTLGGSPEHLFAADAIGGIYRLVGTQWLKEASPAALPVEAFSATATDAWAAGPNGMLLRRSLP